MNHQATPFRAARTWRRTTLCAGVVAAVAAVFGASTAAATEPYPPDEDFCSYDYDEDLCDTEPGAGGGGSSSSGGGSGDDGCSTAHDDDYHTDPLRILDDGIDFGDNNWVLDAPFGFASVQWSVDCGFMSGDVVGTLHLDGVDGHSGRIHVDFIDGAGEIVDTKHSAIRTADGNGHDHWPVNLYSPSGTHITEVQICTELRDDSDPGDDFDIVTCKTRHG